MKNRSNKIFVVIALVAIVAIFIGLEIMNRNATEEKQSQAPVIDESVLIKPHSPIKGDINAKVTLVEFLDPECEACRAMHPIVKQLLAEYDGKIRLVIRYMPLHGNSRYVSAALEEAREQGKFDQALDILFEKQPLWGDHHQPRPELVPGFLKEVGVDEKTLGMSDLLSKHAKKIDEDHADGVKAGALRTPTFFINGKELPQIGYDPMKAAIEKALQETK